MSDLYPEVHDPYINLSNFSSDRPRMLLHSSIAFWTSIAVLYLFTPFLTYYYSFIFLISIITLLLPIFHVLATVQIFLGGNSLLPYLKYSIPVYILAILLETVFSVIFRFSIFVIIAPLVLLMAQVWYYWTVFFHEPTVNYLKDYRSQNDLVFQKIIEFERKLDPNNKINQDLGHLKYYQQERPKLFSILSLVVWIASILFVISLFNGVAPGLDFDNLWYDAGPLQNRFIFIVINILSFSMFVLLLLVIFQFIFSIQVFRLKVEYLKISKIFLILFVGLYLTLSLSMNIIINILWGASISFFLSNLLPTIYMLSPFIVYYLGTYHRNSVKTFFKHYKSDSHIIYDRLVSLEDKFDVLVLRAEGKKKVKRAVD